MNLVSLADWSRAQIEDVLNLGLEMKREPARFARALEGRVLLMIFQKPSLRTRVSFETAMLQLGGHAIHYDLGMSPWSLGKETAGDTARTASRYVDAIMARLFRRSDMAELAEGASVPVINGLTDLEHPCQALGDLMTILEKRRRLRGVRLAYVGDARNNVTHSLLHGCARVGVHIRIGCPAGREFAPAPAVLDQAREFAQEAGAEVALLHDPARAVEGADIVYTDTWMSYHIAPEERPRRERALRPFRVTPVLMGLAKPDALFMHCLPAQRGDEVTADVLDGPRSVVFDQAENRLHSEKAVLVTLLARMKSDRRAPPLEAVRPSLPL